MKGGSDERNYIGSYLRNDKDVEELAIAANRVHAVSEKQADARPGESDVGTKPASVSIPARKPTDPASL